MLRLVFAGALLLLISATPAGHAAIPGTMSFQGVLTDGAGNLVADGNYSLTFRLYTVASGGAAIWTETQPAVAVTKGGFAVQLGSVTTLSTLAFDLEYWLGTSVNGAAELAPRLKLASAPYSRNSESANELRLPFNAFASTTTNTVAVTNNNSASGIGTAILGQTNSSLANSFGVRGSVGANTPAATSAGVRGDNISAGANGTGVWGSQNGTGRGVYGFAPGGTGVSGEATTGTGVQGLSGTATGVLGQTNSVTPNAYAVRGVLGAGTPGNGSAGVRGEGSAGNANTVGVWGFHPGAGAGMLGQSASGLGVSGTTGGGGFAAGVYGSSTGAASAGVKASNSSATGTALEIQQGAFRVAGAGANTTTAAFSVDGNTGESFVVIDNPMCNGDPNALLIVTASGFLFTQGVSFSFYVDYDPISQRWAIQRGENVDMPQFTRFNVLVIKP